MRKLKLQSQITVDGFVGGPQGQLDWMTFDMDASVFAFFAMVCLLTGIIFGLAPALHISKTNVNEVLKEGARGSAGGARARIRSALVIAEVALSLLLLVGAGLMVRTFLNLQRIDVGFRPERAMTLRLSLPEKYKP